MDIIIVVIASLLGSLLTFFSGFGLGTILLPVMILFFPVNTAIAATALVHFLNGVFKFLIVEKKINKEVLLKFGVSAILASVLGAWLINTVGIKLKEEIVIAGFHTSGIKLVVGCLMIFFALLELLPALEKLSFNKRYLVLGGALSGFFGGISGHQGAFRSMFLLKTGMDKIQFLSTGILLGMLIDISRISIYLPAIMSDELIDYKILGIACISAFSGAYLGNKLIKKITVGLIKVLVGIGLMVMGVLIAAGKI